MATAKTAAKKTAPNWGKNRVLETKGVWFAPHLSASQGEPLIGTFMGRRQNSKGTSYAFRLAESCSACVKKREPVTAEVGEIVSLGNRTAVESAMADVVPGTLCRIEALELIDIDGGHTFWRMSVQVAE